MKVGFTGTRKGMSKCQKKELLDRLLFLNPIEFHHGDCLGADAEAHSIVREHFPATKIIIHPPSNPKDRAFCKGDRTYLPVEYLERNKEIVNSVNVMIATPKTDKEELRSGTWATIRFAWKVDRTIIILPGE